MSFNFLDKNGLAYFWSKIKSKIPTKTSDLTNDSDFMSGMTILAYGKSTWNDFITAYTKKHVVYCRASSNSNPASGSQTRMAFMAYVNNETNPTEVEFQYYRSVSSHSASQQGDQVYVYKLNSAGTWSVIVREAMSKIATGSNMSSSYASGTLTLSATVPTNTSDLTNDSDFVSDASYVHTDNNYTTTEKNKLSGIAAGAEVNVNADWDATNGDAQILNKPTIPTKVSELTNDSGYTTNTGTITGITMNGSSKGTSGVVDLGTVITAHQDISGKQDKLTSQTAYTSKGSATKVPQITTNSLGQVTGITEVTITQPTVNNATLTIQKNGTNVQTFTANQSTNAIANITVPMKTSELTNDNNFNYSIEKASGTIDDLAAFTSGKPGITGSISLTKKSSGVGSEIPAGWYNYYFSPHRTGIGGDNMNYGTIILTPMNFSGKSWILRRSSNATTITEVKSISTNEDLSLKTDTSILPNDNGEIKTKYRISNKAYTGSNTTIWYYPLCKLPIDNNGNYASAIISGRIGGWVSANMSYINALAWNRNGTGISLLDIAGRCNIDEQYMEYL